MKTTPFAADHESNIPSGVSIEIAERGADFYADGTLDAWQDGNGMFNRCEATGNLHCYVPVADVRAAITAAESALGVSFAVGAIIPGGDEIEAAMDITTHTNAAGTAYFSTTDEDGQINYSFTKDFEDIWSHDDQNAIAAGFTPSKI